MDDRWETLFSVTDPAADPDGDGETNAQEEDAGTHPNGQVRRVPGGRRDRHASSTPPSRSPTRARRSTAPAVLTFDRGDGTRVRRPSRVPAGRSAVVDVGAVTGLEATDVSTTVESDRLLGVERSMTWGSLADGAIYGSHAETATPSPSPTWFLAEGSTVLGFDLFYLLQNPQATVDARHGPLPAAVGHDDHPDLRPPPGQPHDDLREPGRRARRDGRLRRHQRRRADRRRAGDVPQRCRASPSRSGTDSMGVPAAATSWFLAEGATGAFFDLYVLIANPGARDADGRGALREARWHAS